MPKDEVDLAVPTFRKKFMEGMSLDLRQRQSEKLNLVPIQTSHL